RATRSVAVEEVIDDDLIAHRIEKAREALRIAGEKRRQRRPHRNARGLQCGERLEAAGDRGVVRLERSSDVRTGGGDAHVDYDCTSEPGEQIRVAKHYRASRLDYERFRAEAAEVRRHERLENPAGEAGLPLERRVGIRGRGHEDARALHLALVDRPL